MRDLRNLPLANTLVTLTTSLLTAVLATVITFSLMSSQSLNKDQFDHSDATNASDLPVTPDPVAVDHLRKSLDDWAHYLRTASPDGRIHSRRAACRELESGAQTCVFDGLVCIDNEPNQSSTRPHVYIIDDAKPPGQAVPHDSWCFMRHQSADPRYFSSRHWPILPNTVAPQRSCLVASYMPLSILEKASFTWHHRVALVDLDYVDNPHNNHLLKDIVWMLDIALFQDSLSLTAPPSNASASEIQTLLQRATDFFSNDTMIYLPQSEKNFLKQTARDINCLTYALVLRLDPRKLYPSLSAKQLATPPLMPGERFGVPLFDAFPNLQDRLLFHGDLVAAEKQPGENRTRLSCTSRLTVGAKIGNGAHERVCRSLRERSYALFGVPRPPMRRLGQIYYPQPPPVVLVLNRHITRKLANFEAVMSGLRTAFNSSPIEVRSVSTRDLRNVEDNVRTFSSAGVVISPHGSQNMGQIWMQRHSALIEIMPVGYTDYAFNLLADSCQIWYYELQSQLPEHQTADYYLTECGKKTPHMLNPCTGVKSVDVVANVPELVKTVRFALERLGYAMEPWMDFVKNG